MALSEERIEQIQAIIDSIYAGLAEGNATVAAFGVDGQTVTYTRSQAIEELKMWERKLAVESGAKKTFRGINLGSSF